MIYCLSCKKPTKDVNVKPKVTKNKNPYISANCDICKRLKSKFVSINQIKGNEFLSNLFKSIPILNKDNQHQNHIMILLFLYEDILNMLYLKFV